MRRTALALAVVLIAGFVAAGPAGALRPADTTISVEPSTGLVEGQTVQASGGGFEPNTPLAAAECKAGVTSTEDCDYNTTDFPKADDSGNFSFSSTVRTELDTDNGFVDCTASAGACVLAIADDFGFTNFATTPLSFAPVAPPQSGVLHPPSARAASGYSVDFHATDFAPYAVVEVDICAAGPSDANDCDFPVTTDADENGAFDYYTYPTNTLLTQNHRTIDCTVDGACVYAAWDVRDFTASLTTAPVRLAPEVAGTLTVTPATGLENGDEVTVTGSGWPADLNVDLPECASTTPDAVCGDYGYAQANGDGDFSTTMNVESINDHPYFDCETGSCYIVAEWHTDTVTVSTAEAIVFDVTTTPVTSHYTAAELAAVTGAAATLGVSKVEVQHLGSWGLAWVLAITHAQTLTPAPDSGPGTLTTNWLPSEYKFMNAYAASEGTTLAEFQKTGALFLAYVLALNP